MGILRDVLGARRNDRMIAESEGGSEARHRRPRPGRHDRDKMRCGATRANPTYNQAMKTGPGNMPQCTCGNVPAINARDGQCSGPHLCNDFLCKNATWSK